MVYRFLTYHLEELLSRHGLPDLVEKGAVVDSESWCDTLLEALPVFAIVAVGPLVDGGHAALHFCGAKSVCRYAKVLGCF